ncbi:MAG: hypothetical protein AB7I59_27605 [Geminicoccaceae bacterium]
MTDATDAAEPGVTLTCQPGREGEVLVFPYTVINNSGGDIYVLDAVPELDPESGAPRVNLNTAVVARGEDGFAHILRGIAPLPRDRSVAMRVIPLGTRVPQGGTLERRFTLNEPLHETGPYHPDLPLSRYRLRDIKGVILTVHYLAASAEGFGAAPVDYAAEVFRVFSKNTIGDTRAVSCQMPARGLNILVRTDDFPRP